MMKLSQNLSVKCGVVERKFFS